MERVRLEFPEADIRYRHSLTVRVTDMNYGGHLGHDAMLSLMHEARVQALAALGVPESDMEGYPSIVADLAIQYRAEARWPDGLIIDIAIPAPEGKVFCVYHRARRESDGREVAIARVNMMLLDSSSGRPVVIPEDVCARLAGAA